MISLVKNLIYFTAKIHYYHNRRYKSHITSLKAVIAGKSLIYVQQLKCLPSSRTILFILIITSMKGQY